jgi:hypothetical protein
MIQRLSEFLAPMMVRAVIDYGVINNSTSKVSSELETLRMLSLV